MPREYWRTAVCRSGHPDESEHSSTRLREMRLYAATSEVVESAASGMNLLRLQDRAHVTQWMAGARVRTACDERRPS